MDHYFSLFSEYLNAFEKNSSQNVISKNKIRELPEWKTPDYTISVSRDMGDALYTVLLIRPSTVASYQVYI